MDAADTAMLSLFLSAERLGALVGLTGSTQAAIELHQETLQVGAALMAVTATVEIALRNSVCDALAATSPCRTGCKQRRSPFAGAHRNSARSLRRSTAPSVTAIPSSPSRQGCSGCSRLPSGRPVACPMRSGRRTGASS